MPNQNNNSAIIAKYLIEKMKHIFTAIICMAMAGAIACNNTTEDTSEGKALAETYCASCHKLPTPDLLDKASWSQYMLPRMGVFLGIVEHDSLLTVLFEEGPGGEKAKKSGYFPAKPMLSQQEWTKLKNYFLQNAPEQLQAPKTKTISKDLTLFEVKIPEHKMSPPSATFVQFNTHDNTIYLGDANTQTLSVFSNKLQLLQAAKVKEGAVWVQEFEQEAFVTVMGSFSPTDVSSGFILSLPKVANRPVFKLIDSLQRPVHSAYADLDGDGLMDVVTCEFAKWTGKLSWWKNLGNGKFENKILRNKPGAEKAYIKDLNGDGLQDIIALFGQGDEGIFIFYNQGGGKFKEETALHFSPSNGSSYFQLYDFNQDGHDDIIYTAGDNADFKPVLKNYHGIYVYLNDGKNNFKQEIFYQLNGAYAAFPADYDQDGDIDIAAISFFPDYQNQPEESFVFLENDGKNNFKASTIADPTLGRWIVMDAADYDNDGDLDLILGSLAFEVIPTNNDLINKWVNNGIPFIVLENKTKHK
ncbi:MAG: VCBS repeat-containing protein [Chitinophagaceae bacterium]|nr:VCBS repeat-containing protein [Chitinophagaceae bacterium]